MQVWFKGVLEIKVLCSRKIIQDLMSQSITLEDVPGLYKTHQIPSKNIAKKTRVTQVYGSMSGKDAIDMLDKIEEEKAAKEKAKQEIIKKRKKL